MTNTERMTNTDRIEKKMTLRAPRSRVWRAITTTEEFNAWFGVKLDGAFAEGARKADWRSPADVKRVYANASIVGQNRVVFNIGGNKYRLVVAINYSYRVCYLRFVGTHQAYDRIDVTSV